MLYVLSLLENFVPHFSRITYFKEQSSTAYFICS